MASKYGRTAVLQRLRQEGFSEPRDWRLRRNGLFTTDLVERLAKGQSLNLLQLCGFSELLPVLLHAQVDHWLKARCVVDTEYDPEDYRMHVGSTAGRELYYRTVDFTDLDDLYEDYEWWCASNRMESAPMGAFRRSLTRALPGEKRFRRSRDETVLTSVVAGIKLCPR